MALVLALLLKLSLTSLAQVVTRLRARTFLLPEDAALMRATAVANEAPAVARFAQVWRNDLENLPFFLICALAYTLAGAPATPAWWLFGLYTGLRVAHTAVYLAKLQPWRAIFYLGSLATMWIVAVRAARAVLASPGVVS